MLGSRNGQETAWAQYMTRNADDEDEPVLVPAARTSPNLLQRRATFETITNVFAGAEQTLGGESKSVVC